MSQEEGRIIKGIGGFYTVETAKGRYECKARGLFRKNSQVPFVGDCVKICLPADQSATIQEILPRKNSLVRPPVANLDQLLIVVSVCDPAPSTLVIDTLIAAAENKGIDPILAVSKTDLQSPKALREAYLSSGIPYYEFSSKTGEGVERLLDLLRGKVTALTGNSGVGKSTLLNSLDIGQNRETGEISRKLGRGRHTTRQVELFCLPGGGYVADTPGFSSIRMDRIDVIRKESLQHCFREFAAYLGKCRFPSCSHTCEKGCAVLEAVENGAVSRSRHQSYKAMYQEVKDLKEWEIK